MVMAAHILIALAVGFEIVVDILIPDTYRHIESAGHTRPGCEHGGGSLPRICERRRYVFAYRGVEHHIVQGGMGVTVLCADGEIPFGKWEVHV